MCSISLRAFEARENQELKERSHFNNLAVNTLNINFYRKAETSWKTDFLVSKIINHKYLTYIIQYSLLYLIDKNIN